MRYRSLNLEAFDYEKEGEVERFSSLIADSPAGGMTKSKAINVTLPANLRQRLRQLDKRLLSLQEMIKLGEDLAATLFPPRLRSFLDRSRAALAENEGLRIHLMLDAYELADIPWEYAYLGNGDTPPDQKKINGFLAFDRSVSLLRDPILEQPRRELAPIANQDLRMVVLLSNPLGTQALDLANEQQIIDQAVREIQGITVQYYPKATIDLLRKATSKEAHIFHYSGHGNFKREPGGKEGEGFIQLTGIDGGECSFSATNLAITLNSRGFRLAMLGACESSRVDQVNAWTGIAPALMQAGIPAVVGMQFSILDENAILFSRAFYEGLAEGQPIDEAVAAGRQAIITSANDAAERDWGAPALYLRTEGDGILFPRAAYVAAQALKALAGKLASQAPFAGDDKIPDDSQKSAGDKLPKDSATSTKDIHISEALRATGSGRGDIRDNRAFLNHTFQASLAHLDLVIDYIKLHDHLHELRFSVLPGIREAADNLRDGEGIHDRMRALDLQIYHRGLRRVVDQLHETLNNKRVSAEEEEWVEVLDKASSEISAALKTPKPQVDLLNAAVLKIARVLNTQPTRINVRLIRAVQALRIADLIRIIQQAFDETIINNGDSEEVQRIQQGIEALKSLNSELSDLINEHNIWAEQEHRITIIQTLLPDLQAFEVLWHKVKADISFLYTGNTKRWARRMKEAEEALDKACNERDITAATHQLEFFFAEVTDRFFYVTKELLLKCNELIEIRKNMESV